MNYLQKKADLGNCSGIGPILSVDYNLKCLISSDREVQFTGREVIDSGPKRIAPSTVTSGLTHQPQRTHDILPFEVLSTVADKRVQNIVAILSGAIPACCAWTQIEVRHMIGVDQIHPSLKVFDHL